MLLFGKGICRGSVFPTTLLSLLLVFVTCFGLPASAENPEDAKGLVESIAETVYLAAWPTATYESASVYSVDAARGGFDVSVKLSGKSAFGGGDLWMVLVLKLRQGGLEDVEVVRHNAILAEPFTTAKAVGQLLAELAEEGAASPQGAAGVGAGHGRKVLVNNRCRHSVRLALDYFGVEGTWHQTGWWTLGSGESSYLNDEPGRSLRTASSVLYFYAEALDGAVVWNNGRHSAVVGGRDLSMSHVEDDVGDVDLVLSCPDA
jgi:hypothetical protein